MKSVYVWNYWWVYWQIVSLVLNAASVMTSNVWQSKFNNNICRYGSHALCVLVPPWCLCFCRMDAMHPRSVSSYETTFWYHLLTCCLKPVWLFLTWRAKGRFLKTAHKSCVTTYFSICLSHQDIIWLWKSCAHIIWTTVIIHLCLFWSLKASVYVHSLHSLIAWTKVGRTFFKISSFVFLTGKKVTQVWNDMRVSK